METFSSIKQLQAFVLRSIYLGGVLKEPAGAKAFYDLYGQINVELLIDDTGKWKESSKVRNMSYEYAQAFADYVLSGENMDMHRKKLSDLSNKVADKFLVDFGGRNTQYGPRIAHQLKFIIDELKSCNESRRAWIQVLSADDLNLLSPKRERLTTIEFPCTSSIGFSIEDNRLITFVCMRSSDAYRVLNYDLFNFVSLCEKLAKELDLVADSLIFSCASSHFYKEDEDMVMDLLVEATRDQSTVQPGSKSDTQ